MCGGFTCSKNALTALNLVYILVSFVLIGVAAYGRVASIVSNLAIVGGIIACGVFLFLLSLLGLIGAIKHHQVLLFFYMIILFILFIIQFSVACACLAFNEDQQHKIAVKGWRSSSNELKSEAQRFFNCCGFENYTLGPEDKMGHPSCWGVASCCTSERQCNANCELCGPKLLNAINSGLQISGGVGLFFSFTEVISVWLAYRFREQRDPNFDSQSFL
ncbi:tetraspanin 97E isoform X2 [Tachypleus tridentatus]|uniref:tetraspanin 97E isoform X2 n=1 Tax=Tachypleus tridentatus TaxID=6853 RepID=UPI003FD69B46